MPRLGYIEGCYVGSQVGRVYHKVASILVEICCSFLFRCRSFFLHFLVFAQNHEHFLTDVVAGLPAAPVAVSSSSPVAGLTWLAWWLNRLYRVGGCMAGLNCLAAAACCLLLALCNK